MHRLLLVACVFVVALACRSVPDDGDGPGEQNPDGGASSGTLPDSLKLIFDTPADPVAVTIATDESHAASAILDESGGRISAVGSDGSRFDLDIPAGALLGRTWITLTPVAAIEGLPFGTAPSSVQLAPDGLVLYEFATLTITPPSPLAVNEQILFGWSSNGHDLILAPPVMDSAQAAIRLWHFSGYGVAKGFLADPETVRPRLGGSTEARLQNAIAEHLARERLKALMDGEGSEHGRDTLLMLLKEYTDKVVKLRIAHAEDGCAEAKLALMTVIDVERQAQLLGFDSGLEVDWVRLSVRGGLVCMREEHELCVDDHLIGRILWAWLGMMRSAALLGVDGAPELIEAGNLVEKCLTFDVQFDSEVHSIGSDGAGYDSTVTATARLRFDAEALAFAETTTALVNTAFEMRGPPCEFTSYRGGGDYIARALDWAADVNEGSVSDIRYWHIPLATSERWTMQCPDAPPFAYGPAPMWTTVYLALHLNDIDQERGAWVVSGWSILGGELYARSASNRVDGAMSESSELKLYHRPDP